MNSDIKWFFGDSAAEKHGPNDSITTTFKGDKYYSLAREVLQNSVDAVLEKSKPVEVIFTCIELEHEILPNFWSLKNNFMACKEYFPTQKSFVSFCEKAHNILSHKKIKCLKISDYNTTGLEYSEGTESKFFGFMESVGVTNKSGSGAGGSFGFGKGAYYAASALRTILVSSVYVSNNEKKYIFQGKARLTTHKNTNGSLSDYTGLLGIERGKPIKSDSLVPANLRRVETGTDILIMGFDDETNWKESLIKSVLNNFWYAIYEEKLVVKVEEIEINKCNLEAIISSYYTENSSDGSVNEAESWNPYPYFKAVKFSGDVNTKSFEREFDTLGKVKLFLLLKDGLPNRTVFMRSPKMTVFKKTDNRGFNYVGVFVCDNKKGNEILRQMENPQHNEWKKSNYLENDKPNINAKKAEDELKLFMKECLESLMNLESGKKQKIIGLDKFLNIPEDLIAENEGEGESSGGVHLSNEKTKEETGIEITQKEDIGPIKLEVKKKPMISNIINGETTPEGDTLVAAGTEGVEPNEGTGKIVPPGNSPGKNLTQGNNNGNNSKTILDIKYRVIAQKNAQNEIEHVLKIFSKKDSNGEIELFAGVDNDGENDDSMLAVNAAHLGSQPLITNGNKIKSISIRNGWNTIHVKFDSNQKHSLKINAYEV